MLDPGLEHLHRHGRLWRASNAIRRLKLEAFTDVLLIVPIGLLLVFAHSGRWASPWEIVLLVGAYGVTAIVRFEVGSGSTTPTQLLLVPIWFAVPPGFVTAVVGVGLVFGGLIERLRDHNDEPMWRLILYAGDAWPSIGPATVLALAGAPDASIHHAWIVTGAFAAQVAVDVCVATVMCWVLHRIRPLMQMRLMVWVCSIDAALFPIGFLVAVVMATEPVAIVAVLPLVGLIAEFARERKDRLEQAFQLSSAYRGTAQLMGDVLEADDAYTGGEHTQGVVDMTVAVGLELRLDPRAMRDLEFGALLHDIGKLRVPNEIINKPGGLNASEWALIRKHPEYGQQMLNRVGGVMTDAGRIVRAHHERWDGLGYPDRLVADEIPLAARIITVCDSFSAMTTTRSYSPAMTHDEGIAELKRCAGTQFDPAVVDALILVLEREPALANGAGQIARDAASSPIAAALGLRPLT